MRLLALLITVFSLLASAQSTAEQWITKGDAAAHDDRHAEAIADYEAAIVQAPELRQGLLAKLGRQHLWSDHSEKASKLLGEYVKLHPEDCNVYMDYGLSLSWSNQLSKAKDVYRILAANCPQRRIDALLGEARSARWMDRPTVADALYKEVLRAGDDRNRQEASIGLGLDQLLRDNNRVARQLFEQMLDNGELSPSVFAGASLANWRLGYADEALQEIDDAQRRGIRNRDLNGLADDIQHSTYPVISPSFAGSHDSDGTSYFQSQLSGTSALGFAGRLNAFTGVSQLSSQKTHVQGYWAGAGVEHRFNPSLALRGDGRLTEFAGVAFRPFTGELDAVFTPTDRTRMDLAAARIVIADNIAALDHHLVGTFISGGLDQKVTDNDHLSLTADATEWSEKNRRLRFRFNPQHQFEGVPRLTVSLPVLYQNYNNGFAFSLFSPRSYIEIGPAANLYLRKAQFWTFSLMGRIGAQKESALPWKPLGTAQIQVEREISRSWGFHANVGYSSSNLESSTGFSRTSFSLSLLRWF